VRAIDDGALRVALTVTDEGGLTDTARTEVRVVNVAPLIIDPGPKVATVGEALLLELAFSDPGIRDTHVVTVDWGDGSTEEAIVSEASGSGIASARHTYADAGTYSVTVTVTDDDGGVGSLVVEVTVEGDR
jgi:PKD repeat protein